MAAPSFPAPDPSGIKALLAEMPSAVTIITAWSDDGRPIGATLSAVSSLSLVPPLMLACFNAQSQTLRHLTPGRHFLIHILSSGQESVAGLFASRSADKFEGIAWNRGLMNLPQLVGSAGLIACTVESLLPGGDHAIVIGGILQVSAPSGASPLIYHRRVLHPLEIRS